MLRQFKSFCIKFSDSASRIVNNERFDVFISLVIVVNCLILGIQTIALPVKVETAFVLIDRGCLLIYVMEIFLRFVASPRTYFKSGWNIFDLTIVMLSFIPELLSFPPQVARIIRLFRTFRALLLVSALKPLRKIITSLVRSLPSIFWTVFLLAIICYVYGIAGYYFFGQDHPEYFGDLGSTLFTLFQLTTLENWAEIARDVMATQPASAFYFISFVLISAFVIVNVIVGVIVSSIEETARVEREE